MSMHLTSAGIDLLHRALAGEAEISFTSVQIGNGPNAGSDPSALSAPQMTLPIRGTRTEAVYFVLECGYNNAEVVVGFRRTELGVFAVDPDDAGRTILYGYEYIPSEEADYVPARTDRTLETVINVMTYVGEAESVTATVNVSLAYATKTELAAHASDGNKHVSAEDRARWDSSSSLTLGETETTAYRGDRGKSAYDHSLVSSGNPHGVTKGDVGLGNVPNVATNDQEPTYTAASSLSALTSGEKLSLAFGKIAKAVGDLISHLADNVSHITAAERTSWNGKAAGTHTHNESDISWTAPSEDLTTLHATSGLAVDSPDDDYMVYILNGMNGLKIISFTGQSELKAASGAERIIFSIPERLYPNELSAFAALQVLIKNGGSTSYAFVEARISKVGNIPDLRLSNLPDVLTNGSGATFSLYGQIVYYT